MKKIVLLLFSVPIVIFSSFEPKNQYGDVTQKIIVAGKINNYDPSREVYLAVNWIGFMQEQINPKIDSVGNFMAIIESYVPIDAWLGYRTNFLVLLHPGDSLFIHFDGQYGNRPAILNTIEFGGDAAQTNQYAAKFQQMYFSNELFTNRDRQNMAVKDYDAEQYVQYLDTIKQKSIELYDKFVAENNPNEESKKWAQLYIEENYNYNLGWYANNHRRANNMERDNLWDVPSGFYNKFYNSLPIDHSMFICSHAISGLSSLFLHRYIRCKLKDKGDIIAVTANSFASKDIDSVSIFGVIEFVHDPLFRQILLTEYFNNDFQQHKIAVFERFRDVADTYIKEHFLREPLLQKYIQLKSWIDNPQENTEAILKEAANLSINQIVDEILQQNKNKVIYVDFWATWCGPCLAEFPNSKILEREFEGKDVVFVYICLDSEEKQFKVVLDKYQIGGQHYILSRTQSAEMRTLFEISGIPSYLLIDKNGVIKEKGSHLRPLDVKNKIKEMMK